MVSKHWLPPMAVVLGIALLGSAWAWESSDPDASKHFGQDEPDRTEAMTGEDPNVPTPASPAVEQSKEDGDTVDEAVSDERDDVVRSASSDSLLSQRDATAANMIVTDGGIQIQVGASADAVPTNEHPSGETDGDAVARALDAASSQLTFQALLTDNDGNPLPGDEVIIEANIYDAAGRLIEGPIGPARIPMNNGVVDTLFPVLARSFDGTARELGISVNREPELTPRIKLGAVPYAFRVDRVASEELDDDIELGSASDDGELTIWDGTSGVETVRMSGAANRVSTFGDDNNERVRLWGPTFGEVLLFDGIGNERTVRLSSGPDLILPGSGPYHEFGGQLTLTDSSGGDTIFLGGASATVNTTGGFQLVDTIGSGASVLGDLSLTFGGAEIDLADELGTRAFWGGADSTAGGFLNLYQKDGGLGLELDGDATDNDGGGDITVFQADGAIGVFLDGDSVGAGFVSVRNSSGSSRVQLDGQSTGTGGRVIVSDATGSTTVDIFGAETDTTGGRINIEDAGSGIRVALDGESVGTGGEISVFDDSGTETVEILGDEASGGEGSGQILLRNSSGTNRIEIDADGSSGARIQVLQDDGTSGIAMDGQANEGALFRIFQDDGDTAIIMEGDSSAGGATGGGRIRVRNAANVSRVFIDGNYNNTGLGRVRADIIRVQGGVDLAEPFICKDKAAVKPGMVMSIDPTTAGRLMVASQAYDRKVAGIVSGAGGVQPGITLSQEGVMEGDHLVALTGRVYCLCDASTGAIQPGDMLTTSSTPGHAMLAADHSLAQGAIIGKAMTSLTDGTGLVLVLVQPQ